MPEGLLQRILGTGRSIFTGGPQAGQRLSPEDESRARRDALINAGLTTILQSTAAGAPPGGQADPVAAIIQGALAGREAGGRSRAAASQLNQGQAIIQDLQSQIQAGELTQSDVLQMMVQTSLTNPDLARALGEVAKTMGPRGSPVNLQREEIYNPETQQVEIWNINPRTGERVSIVGQAPPSTQRYQTLQLPGEDKPGVYLMDSRTGLPIARVGDDPGTSTGGQQERMNQRLGAAAAEVAPVLDELDHNLTSVSASLSMQAGVLGAAGNLLANPDQQRAATAALNFINPVVRFLSGAQMTEQEAERYYRALVPRFGDEPETVEFKARMRRTLLRAMQAGDIEPAEPSDEPDFGRADRILTELGAGPLLDMASDQPGNRFLRNRDGGN